jgi:benzoate/toluate 1,2-dioxygenase subunit beta
MAKKTKKKVVKAKPAARRAVAQRRRMPVAVKVNAEAQREVEQFHDRQSEHLDGKRWQDFIDLFAADGVYWVPAAPEQTTGDGVPSIFYEDRNLMTVRLKRLAHPRAWSQKTAWGTNHVVSNVTIESEDKRSGEIVARSRFHLMEFRNDTTRHFAGSYVHRLRRTKDGLRIVQQRVDMVNAQGPYEYVLQAWV